MNILVFPGNDDVFYRMFDEVNNKQEYPDILIYKNVYKKFNDLIFKIRNKLSYHRVLNGLINDIFDNIISPLLIIKNINFNSDETCLVFSNLTIRVIPDRILKKLLLNPKLHIAVYILDSSSQMLCKEAIEKCIKNKINLTYTFDNDDANKYGFHHIYYIYSKIVDTKNKTDVDVMFFGSDKGRLIQLTKISNFLANKGISSRMSIVGANCKLKSNERIIYNKPVSYEEMLKELQGTNCILDYVIDNQAGLSYRPMEAICYNKKLLTNNKKIFDFPFYNPKYMRYFESIEYIDVDFLRNNETVNYGYLSEYSPLEFIKILETDIYKGRSHE